MYFVWVYSILYGDKNLCSMMAAPLAVPPFAPVLTLRPALAIPADPSGGVAGVVPRWQQVLASRLSGSVEVAAAAATASPGPLALLCGSGGRAALADALQLAPAATLDALDALASCVPDHAAAAAAALDYVRFAARRPDHHAGSLEEAPSAAWWVILPLPPSPALPGAAGACRLTVAASGPWDASASPSPATPATAATPATPLVVISSTAAGLDKGSPIAIPCPAGNKDNDGLMVEHGVALLENRFETVRLEDRPFSRALAEHDEACPPLPSPDVAIFVRDSTSLGPSWPGIPGPDAIDLSTLMLARWLISLIPSSGASSPVPFAACRHPLPFERELLAWDLLANMARRALSRLPTTIAADETRLRQQDEDMLLAYRLDKKRLLATAAARLERAAANSRSCGRLMVEPPREDPFLDMAARMPPPVRALLVDLQPPDQVSPSRLLRALQLSEAAYRAAYRAVQMSAAEAVLSQQGVAPAAACAALRQAVDREATTRKDTVDGAPDWQLNLPAHRLERLWPGGLRALRAVADRFLSNRGDAGDSVDAVSRLTPPRMFVRRYTASTRPFIPFHCDNAAVTVNVALSGDGGMEGGKLLAVYAGAVREVGGKDGRREGEATAHASSLLHAVTRMTKGGGSGSRVESGRGRYSLIAFYDET